MLRQYVAQPAFPLAQANNFHLLGARSGRRKLILDVFVARMNKKFSGIYRWVPDFELRQFVTIDSTDDPVEFLPN